MNDTSLVATATTSNTSAALFSPTLTLANASLVAPANTTLPVGEHGSLEAAAQSTRLLLAFLMLEFVVLWLLCVVLVARMRYYRSAAFRGDEAAARKILLPAFEPLLVVLAVFNAVFTVLLSAALATKLYSTYVPPVVLETLYSAHQFGFVLITVFMLEKSVSVPALRRAVVLALVLSGYSIPYIWYATSYGAPATQIVYVHWLHVVRAVVLLLSVYIFVWPPSRASVRTLRELAVYNFVRYGLTTVHMVLVVNPATRADAKYALFATLVWIAFNPLVIWRVLQADTDYWRGMGQRCVALQELFKQTHHVHDGVSSQGLHVLLEMHRKYVIDFAHLELRAQIGVGATSTVFRGTYRTTHRVAIKVYEPRHLSDDILAGFSHEAALCGLLHHPNIVTFFGLCVSPPTICLVFELCQGSLDDAMRVHIRQQSAQHGRPMMARQQLLIRIGYMLDAARAVAYLHSFSPPFLHRDIKPSNFLLDVDCHVKLTDFGESRALTQLQARGDSAMTTTGPSATTSRHSAEAKGAVHDSRATQSPSTATLEDETFESPLPSHWTVKGTADYMAPEVIRGKRGFACYDEAADVYSLAVTMWDVVHPGVEKFASRSHLYVFDRVLSGARPPLDPTLFPRLRDLIQRAWHAEPQQRPSARSVVAALEEIQEAISADVIVDVLDDLQQQFTAEPPPQAHLATAPTTVTCNWPIMGGKVSGAAAADVLLERNYVRSLAEATRMGNAWMDAGLLHHVRHAQAFEPSHVALYYFAVDSNATLRDAIERAASGPSSSIPLLTNAPLSSGRASPRRRLSRSSVADTAAGPARPNRVCACSQLAQRLVEQRSVRDKWRMKAFGGSRRPAPLDDLVLTTALLMDDQDDSSDDHFDAFTGHGESICSSRDGSDLSRRV